MASNSPMALIISSNRLFSARVAEILDPLGCEVTRAFSMSAVTKNFRDRPFDLLLIGIVRADDQQRILAQLRLASHLRDVPLVFLIAPDLDNYAPELGAFLEMKSPITNLADFRKEVALLLDRTRPDRYQALAAAKFDFYVENPVAELRKLAA